MKYSFPALFNLNSSDTKDIEYVKKYLLSFRQSVNRIVNEKDEEAKTIKNMILTATNFANDDFYTFRTRLFFFLSGYTDFPVCEREGCHNKIIGHNLRDLSTPWKFPSYCCDICKYDNLENVQKRQKIKDRLELAKSFTDEQMIEQLKQVIAEHPFNHVTHIIAKDNWWSFLYDFIMRKTPMLDDRYTMHTRIGWILNGYTDFPKCENPNCTKTFEGKNIDRGTFVYPHFCSQKCEMNTPYIKEKCKKSKNLIYGDRTIERRKEIAHEKCIENRKKSDEEKIEILRNIVQNNPYNYERVIHSKCKFGCTDDNTYLEEFINEKTPLLQKEIYTLPTKLFWVLNGLTDFPLCKYCNKPLVDFNVKTLANGYVNYCSKECAINDGAYEALTTCTYCYNDILFHSSWELAYYIWLVDNKVNFTFHPNNPLKYIFENETHYYYPDFIVDNQIVEIKGDQFFDDNGNLINPYRDDGGKSLAKQKCMENNNVVILKEDDITKYLDYVSEHYGKEYLKTFKRV